MNFKIKSTPYKPKVKRFETLGVCSYEGYKRTNENECYSTDVLTGINPKTPMTGASAATNVLNAVLCVEKKNYAFKVFTNIF